MAFKIGDNTVIDNNRALTAVGVTAATNLNIPTGNTAGRPTGAVGKLYFDTDLGKLLVHNGTTWIVSGTSGFDLAAHDTSYNTGKLITASAAWGANYSNIAIYYAQYNEAVQYFLLSRHINSSNRPYWDFHVKFKDMPHLVLASDQFGNGDSWSWPDGGSTGDPAYQFIRPHSISLDNKAIAFNTGGTTTSPSATKKGQCWLFDATYPGSGFVIETHNQTVLNNQSCAGIYKFSDTQYVAWTTTNYTNLVGTGGVSHLRCYNPTTTTEGNRVEEGDAWPIWGKSYQSTQTDPEGKYLHNQQRAGWAGVWKSATANQLSVLHVNSRGLNGTPGNHPAGGNGNGWKLAIFDVNMTTGVPVAGSEVYFEPPSSTMPSTKNFSVCECTTHVTWISWPELGGQPKTTYSFWIWDKANRNLRKFTPEVGANTTFNSSGNSNQIFMWHFKMNDKIYCCISELETTGDSDNQTRRHTNIYETTATTATKYMQIYNDANNQTAPETQAFAMQMIPQHGTDSFQFTKRQASWDGQSYDWTGQNSQFEADSTNDGMNYYTVTTKPETSKTSLGANFTGVTSANWTGTAPTLSLNPNKITSNVPTWSVLNSDNVTTGNNADAGWSYNMLRKTFYEGKKLGNE